jgi:hypothetical protein
MFTPQQADVRAEISFSALHFHEFSLTQIYSLGFSRRHKILSDQSLRHESEDRLCKELLDLTESDCEYFSLFGFIRFEFVSLPLFSAFLDRLERF